MKKIAIIGAGLSGLTLAKKLSKIAHVQCFESLGKVSGRLSTVENKNLIYDNGAQFFTVRSKEFLKFLQPLLEKNIVQPWMGKFIEITNGEISNEKQWDSEHPHYVGVPGMQAIGEFLSKDIECVKNTQICEIVPEESKKLSLISKENKKYVNFDWVITAIPPSHAQKILPKNTSYIADLDISMLPCCSLLLEMRNDPKYAFDAALVKQSIISWISFQKNKPGKPKNITAVALSSNLWATENIGRKEEDISNDLVEEFCQILKIHPELIKNQKLFKWEFANCNKRFGQSFFADENLRIASIGDWCSHGRVEAAFLSANAFFDAKKVFFQ